MSLHLNQNNQAPGNNGNNNILDIEDLNLVVNNLAQVIHNLGLFGAANIAPNPANIAVAAADAPNQAGAPEQEEQNNPQP